MQWNSDKNAGFSDSNPWIKVNDNYSDINVNESLNDENSIYHFYQKLLKLRNSSEVAIDGEFKLVSSDDSDVFAYTRTLNNKTMLIVGSFSENKVKFDIPDDLVNEGGIKVLSNYDDAPKELPKTLYLRPYEGIVFING